MIKGIEVGGVRHSIQAENTIKTTWAELKALRDEAKLNAGTFYRITDYVTTTTQSQTKSANHPFDVIVLALSENTLSEDAKAALNAGDTYFADSDLSAWELKYCLDNDSQRFSWADKTNGKGVIYRMIDENQNDCPYDFKNILHSGYYTFYLGSDDASIKKIARVAYNTIHWRGGSIRKVVFDIPMLGVCRYNSVGANSSGRFFGSVENNIIGDGCSFAISDSSNNIIGNECHNINITGSSNIVKSYNRNLNVRSTNTVVEEHFNDDAYKYPEISKSATTYTSSVQRGENFHDDGSGQVVPIKHPDLSTQPSILPYKFMGQYVYEQLIMMMNFDNIINSKQYYCSELGLLIKDNPLILEADLIIKSEQCTFTAPLTVKVVSDVISFGFNINNLGFDSSLISSGDMCIVRIVYTSMPEGSTYYEY